MQPAHSRALSGRVALLRNAALSSGVQYAESAIGLLVSVVIARTLGPSSYGHYAFAVWLCGWMLTASNHGLTMSAIRFIAEARGAERLDDAARLSAMFLRWQRYSSILILGCFIVVASVWPPDEWEGQLSWMVPLSVVAVWARARFWMLGSIGKGYEQFAPESFAILGMITANLLATGVWWALDRTALSMFAIYTGSGVLCSLLAQRLLRSSGIVIVSRELPPPVERKRARRTVLAAGVLAALGLLGGRSLETVLLKAYWSPEVFAYFVIAGTLAKGAVDVLSGGLASILLPAMSRAFGGSGITAAGDVLVEAIRFYWCIGLLMSAMAVVIVPGAISLFYGARYEPAIPVVTWTLVIVGLGVFTGAFAAFQTAADHQGDRLWCTVGTLLVGAVAALALVPTWGLNGAIVSGAITRLAGVAIQTVMVRRRVRFRIKWKPMWRLLLAAALACALAVWMEHELASRFAFAITGVFFCVAFLILSIILRSWYESDYALAAEVAKRCGGIGLRVASVTVRVGSRFAL